MTKRVAVDQPCITDTVFDHVDSIPTHEEASQFLRSMPDVTLPTYSEVSDLLTPASNQQYSFMADC